MKRFFDPLKYADIVRVFHRLSLLTKLLNSLAAPSKYYAMCQIGELGGGGGCNTNIGNVNIKKVYVIEMRPLSKLKTKANSNTKNRVVI